MTVAPKTNKDWAKEIRSALQDGLQLLIETEQEVGLQLQERLFIAAPVIAMKNRGFDFTHHEDALNYACESVVTMLKEYPDLRVQYHRCFVHAYIDTHIYLKLFKASKAESLFFYLESKGIIES